MLFSQQKNMNITKTQITTLDTMLAYFREDEPSWDKVISIGRSRDRDTFYVDLNFTRHGDYCGSTVEKSNHDVLINQINELSEHEDYFNQLEGIERYIAGYSTSSIRIIGDLPTLVWEVILSAIASIEDYPLLDDEHYSDQQSEDCWDSWMSYQYSDVIRELQKRNVDTDILEANATEDDQYSWLYEIILNPEKIEQAERIEVIEINAQSYYDISDEVLDELAIYLINQSNLRSSSSLKE